MAFDDLANAWAPRALSILRIVSGLLLLEHGTGKHLGFPAGVTASNAWASGAGYFELIGGVLMVLGLFTRPVAFVLCGMTAVAYFMVHAPQGFFPILNRGELAVLYCFVFLYMTAAGPGPWSIDAARRAA